MDATSPSSDDEGLKGLHNLIADKSEEPLQVQKVRTKTFSNAMSRNGSDERIRTQGSDVPLPESK